MVEAARDEHAHAVAMHRARTAFRRMQRRATVRSLLGRVLGKPVALRSFEELRRDAEALVTKTRNLEDVCLDRVLGSLERPHEYTPDFLPRMGHDEDRWVRVRLAVEGDHGVPPLDLIEVDGAYYVRDGHHRVSVLKHMGVRSFESWVTHVEPLGSKTTSTA